MNKVKVAYRKLFNIILSIVYPYYVVIDRYSMIERMSMGFSRGALNKAGLQVDKKTPASWEFCAFSQNGEDGIVDYLTSFIKNPNRYFIEIGSSDGLENNCSYLAFSKKYSGIMIEGDSAKSNRAKTYLERFNWGVKYINCFVNKDNIAPLLQAESLHTNPDFFSLDIDGIDYYIMESLLESGFRPKLVCVEYNSSFGPSREITIRYTPNFNYAKAHSSRFYYGVSIAGWRKLFKKFQYNFITVETNGVNAFFVDNSQFKDDFPKDISANQFIENFALRSRHRNTWKEQYALINDKGYYEI